MAGEQITYNSINWNSTYNFQIVPGGIIGALDLVEPRDDGYDEIPTNDDIIASYGADAGKRVIIINGLIQDTTNSAMLSKAITLRNALDTIRAGVTWYNLSIEPIPGYYFESRPRAVIFNWPNKVTGVTGILITVSFDCKSAISVVSP